MERRKCISSIPFSHSRVSNNTHEARTDDCGRCWNTLLRILTEPKNALTKQYERLFDMEGIKLTFSDEVLNLIVDKSLEYSLGARGLRSICEAIMTDAMFEMPSKEDISEFEVTIDYAEAKLNKTKLAVLKQAV